MNFTDLSKEEVALVLDALSTMPLNRSYNLFNKLVLQAQAQGMQLNVGISAAPASSPSGDANG